MIGLFIVTVTRRRVDRFSDPTSFLDTDTSSRSPSSSVPSSPENYLYIDLAVIACHLPIGIGHDDDYLIDLIYFYGSNMEGVMSVLPGRTMSTVRTFLSSLLPSSRIGTTRTELLIILFTNVTHLSIPRRKDFSQFVASKPTFGRPPD